MELCEENYYSREADVEYMSVSQFKNFNGTYGRKGCEFEALMKLAGRWNPEPSLPLLMGSYVDSYFDGPDVLKKFQDENWSTIFTQGGDLRSPFKKCERMINRCEDDEYFMQYMSGQKQVIMTADLFGTKWKIKMDSYIPGIAIVDLKTVKSIRKLHWVRDIGYLDFVQYWGYDIQGAVYQKVVELNTGKKLPFYIAAVSKEEEPDIEIIQVTQNYLNEALTVVETALPKVLKVKTGQRPPDHCGTCDCCKRYKKLSRPISLIDLHTI